MHEAWVPECSFFFGKCYLKSCVVLCCFLSFSEDIHVSYTHVDVHVYLMHMKQNLKGRADTHIITNVYTHVHIYIYVYTCMYLCPFLDPPDKTQWIPSSDLAVHVHVLHDCVFMYTLQ